MRSVALHARKWAEATPTSMARLALGLALSLAYLSSMSGCGTSDPAPQPMGDGCGTPTGSMASACPCGTVLYRLQGGLYDTLMAEVRKDSCGLGLTADMLHVQRQVSWNLLDGTIAVTGQDVGQVLGSAAVRCNRGQLARGPVAQSEGPCQYTLTRSGTIQITADNTATLVIDEDRRDFSSVAGMTCASATPCHLAYSLVLYKPVQ